MSPLFVKTSSTGTGATPTGSRAIQNKRIGFNNTRCSCRCRSRSRSRSRSGSSHPSFIPATGLGSTILGVAIGRSMIIPMGRAGAKISLPRLLKLRRRWDLPGHETWPEVGRNELVALRARSIHLVVLPLLERRASAGIPFGAEGDGI